MIVTVTKVTDFDQFLTTFSTIGLRKRRQHGCKGSEVIRDPEVRDRIWVIFDWSDEDYERFLADPEVPAIAAQLGLGEPPITTRPIVSYDH